MQAASFPTTRTPHSLTTLRQQLNAANAVVPHIQEAPKPIARKKDDGVSAVSDSKNHTSDSDEGGRKQPSLHRKPKKKPIDPEQRRKFRHAIEAYEAAQRLVEEEHSEGIDVYAGDTVIAEKETHPDAINVLA